MAQFVAPDPTLEVSGEAVLAFVNSMEKNRDTRLAVLEKFGIIPNPKGWYSMQSLLNAYKFLQEDIGEMNIFLIGKAIIENAKFPPIKTLKDGLESINIAYHMNHRLNKKVMFDFTTGKTIEGIGSYQLTSFDEKRKVALMRCRNPYPSKLDEGIITQISRKFKPANSMNPVVKLDLSQETRINGGNTCTFQITW